MSEHEQKLDQKGDIDPYLKQAMDFSAALKKLEETISGFQEGQLAMDAVYSALILMTERIRVSFNYSIATEISRQQKAALMEAKLDAMQKAGLENG